MNVFKPIFPGSYPWSPWSLVRKAVSEMFISAAICCFSWSDMSSSSRQTAAGFPLFRRRNKENVRQPMLHPQKKDLYRREGKGRRCILEDRIDSIPCRASYFAQEQDKMIAFQDEIILFFKSSWCSSSDNLCLLFCINLSSINNNKNYLVIFVTNSDNNIKTIWLMHLLKNKKKRQTKCVLEQ